MADSNGLPPKVYRKLLSSIYLQNLKDAKAIKENWSRNGNPICQKENRYFSPRTKGNILTQEYIKRMAEKPERPHIKRIPIPTNLSSGVTVITEPKKVEGIKLGPNRKNQAHSAERREVRKKLYKDNFNNFYFDAFNSVKRNQNDLSALRSQVSIKKLIFINFQSFIFVF